MNIFTLVFVIWLVGTLFVATALSVQTRGQKMRLFGLTLPFRVKGRLFRVAALIVGLLIFAFAAFETHQLTKMPEVKSVVFELEDGTKIIVPLQIRRIALFPTTFEPPEIGILAQNWDRLTEEEQRKALADVMPKLPDETLVSLKGEGMETFEVKFWKDLSVRDQATIFGKLQLPYYEIRFNYSPTEPRL